MVREQLELIPLDEVQLTSLAKRMPRSWGDLSLPAKQFYTSKLKDIFRATSGTQFEVEVAKVLKKRFRDYENPDPMGSQGDWGCDGYINNGRTLFACYGTQNIKKENDYVRRKVRDDLDRALKKWPMMTEWIFATNTKLGPEFYQKTWMPLVEEHGENSKRPVTIQIWRYDDVAGLLPDLTEGDLDLLWPGYADVDDFELKDLIEVVDQIMRRPKPSRNEDGEEIEEVSPQKMSYNRIVDADRHLLNSGIALSPRIESFFASHEDPEKRDEVASRLHTIWRELDLPGSESTDVLHALFRKIGGDKYDVSGKTRRMSTYALAAFFFQSCDIFESVPEGWAPGMDGDPL